MFDSRILDNLLQLNTQITPAKGRILIAEPLMLDSFFRRSVIYLCHYSYEESFGFTLNQKSDMLVSDLSTQFYGIDLPVYFGGPVGADSLHILHTSPSHIQNAEHVKDSIAWGGDLDQVIELIRFGKLDTSQIKFFLGYSGWGEEQLDSELKRNSWLVSNTTPEFVFNTSPDAFWQHAIQDLGHKFKPLLNMPIDATLN